MQEQAPILPYEPAKGPNPLAKPSLICGIILLFGSLVPICGLAVVPLAVIGVIAALIGVGLAIWGKRRGLVMSIAGLVLCIAATFIPIGLLGTIPFLTKAGLRFWASEQNSPAPAPPPMTAPTTTANITPTTTTAPASD